MPTTKSDFYRNKKIVVTGAAGTVGKELVRQLLDAGCDEVRALDNAETNLFFVEQEFQNSRLQCFLCDICNQEHISHFFEGADYVFHVAAYKHVPACERHPDIAVQNNILGVQSIISAARSCGVRRVLFTSSDKAVNPTNVMGTSKLMGERLFTAANVLNTQDSQTIYASTRFGNVAGSSGSVVQIFEDQIRKGAPITITHNEMTRFMMTLEESVSLVRESLAIAKGGEVFVTKMPVIRIIDLARGMIELLAPVYGRDPKDIPIKVVGIRPGEKLYEELTTDEELARTVEMEKMFVVLPAFRNIYKKIDYEIYDREGKPADRVYNSAIEKVQDYEQVVAFLERLGVGSGHH